MNENSREMPRYKCHKEVHALKIGTYVHDSSKGMTLYFDDISFESVDITEADMDRFSNISPDDKGYYVVYEDGYFSWSPTKAFEEGYTRI